MKIRQNDWSEFGKDFIVKMRKNTGGLRAFQHFIIRKNTQEFSRSEFHNILKTSKIQNMKILEMDKKYPKLGNTRSIR
ncbi:MAG: hypothetical protein J6T16_01260 [Opitutales bacterium]|nr:hypothetical protein [Opitutales bacterium]